MRASELVNRAYVLAGITARELDTTSGSEGADGLFWLNQVLDQLSITTRYLPYVQQEEIILVPHQEVYFVENLARLDVLTFTYEHVRFSMKEDTEREYFGSPRVDNVYSLPYHYYSKRVNGGTEIYIYFKPDKPYVLNITGRYDLGEVIATTELNDTFTRYYQTYLMYELADALCDWFKISLPPPTKEKLLYFRRVMMDLNPLDLSIGRVTLLGRPTPGNWALINAKGYLPP